MEDPPADIISTVLKKLIPVFVLALIALPSAQTPPPFEVHEASIAQIHGALMAKRVTCRGIVEQYLRRIDAFDKNGPALNAIVITNPDALKQAEMMSPIVLWIDEIEKGFASAASHSVDGGLSQRMFGTLLTWMQEHEKPVFLVATANDIDALPPELLRKGRFDEIFFVDLPGAAVRKEIFAIHLKRRKRDPKRFDLDALAVASDGFSGAEIEQAVIAALHAAFAEGAEIETDQLVAVLKRSPPLSVTAAERVEGLRLWARGRCVPAD